MSKTYFTSDTHFGSQRTLELSKRPFDSVKKMDKTMINNWNKVVKKGDVVYHLGDFGDYKNFKHLNGQIKFIIGNYEYTDLTGKKDVDMEYHDPEALLEVMMQLQDKLSEINPNVTIIFTQYSHRPMKIEDVLSENLIIDTESIIIELTLFHKPSTIMFVNTSCSDFYLFGHIHNLQMVKPWGLNVSVDCHNFTPVSSADVGFYYNAIKNVYDKNVFGYNQPVLKQLINKDKIFPHAKELLIDNERY